MSIFRSVELPCPTCKTPVPFELVHSVNADRRPDLRAAILDGSFQKQPCPSCGFAFRVEPEFTYIDLGRKQFFAVWPGSKLKQWHSLEQRSRDSFDKAFGASAPPEARALGVGLQTRAVFGWAALNEKLIAADAGIDDVTLELAKVGVVRSLDEAPVAGDYELRLLAIQGDDLMLGWVHNGSEELKEVVSVPKHIVNEIEADAAAWQSLRDDLSAGLFVDFQRSLVGA